MRGRYEVKVQIIGVDPSLAKEGCILNRTIRWDKQGIEIESDSRHVKEIILGLGLKFGKPAANPIVTDKDAKKLVGEKDRDGARLRGSHRGGSGDHVSRRSCSRGSTSSKDQGRTDELLDAADTTCYRGLAARLNFLSLDRPDLRYAAMVACTQMAAPTQSSWAIIKRVGRYLVGRPRAVCVFRWQDKVGRVNAYADADWGGDRATRRSVSGGCLFWGSHCVKYWARKQQVVALSSAESELYAGLKTATEAIGVQSLAKDMGHASGVHLYLDSSAALSLTDRRGLGKAKHIDLQHLWLQDAVKEGRIHTHKVPTEINPADLMTKPLAADRIEKLMKLMGFHFRDSASQE